MRSLNTVKVLVALKLKGRKDYDFDGDANKIEKLVVDLKEAAQMSLDAKQHESFLLTRNFAAGTYSRYLSHASAKQE
jgi:hypothetical protein